MLNKTTKENNISTNTNSIVTPKIIGRHSKRSTKHIISGTNPLNQKIYQSDFYPDFYDDLGLDNLYNDTPDADLRDY